MHIVLLTAVDARIAPVGLGVPPQVQAILIAGSGKTGVTGAERETTRRAGPAAAKRDLLGAKESSATGPVVPSGASRPSSGTRGPEAAAPTPEATRAGLDAVRQYVLDLVPEARRHKHYPDAARQNGWEGTAEIAVSLRGWQAEPLVSLARSSGHPLLDESALSTVGEAVRRVEPPSALRGGDLTIAVPVRFRLDD